MMEENKVYDPLGDGISRLQLINWMGDDLDVANDARASFEKISTKLDGKDIKLIHYLVNNEHTSPLRGVVFKFRVKAPLFVARQWWKHVIASSHNDEQLGWNEKSFRYVPIDTPEFYLPSEFRYQSSSNKQSSEGALEGAVADKAHEVYYNSLMASYEAYQALLGLGVCREQARGVLPPSVYTSWVWTTSLQAILHFVQLRMGHGAQSEIKGYADAMVDILREKVPHTVAAWSAKHGVGG